MSRQWMPMFWGDYLADTRHLSTLQHGVYLLLIAHYWQHRGLPNDDYQLANIAGIPLRSWLRHKPTLQKFFVDEWRHERVERELKRRDEAHIRRITAGSKGGTVSSINRHRRH